jgi:hypothetical protein
MTPWRVHSVARTSTTKTNVVAKGEYDEDEGRGRERRKAMSTTGYAARANTTSATKMSQRV